ncbi:taste receptor type 1 member 1 [Oncorhynchus keta]|uniref:taste receptor type 1 member 1 n=1 Tax=Oncorhynchus keta TaxID=8018 RepID=UPI0015F9A4BF|nr:taste receptor type 1 member 1 [Oncorhynchus keta]
MLGSFQHGLPESYSCSASEFKLDGEYILGGLFDIHHRNSSVVYNRPVIVDCSRQSFTLSSYRMFQVMRFAVQEINNSSLILPNVSLGYEIFDHCSDKFNFQAILNMISRNGSIQVLRCVNEYLSKVIAVAGPFRSMESMTVAPMFAMNLIPMVNYGSSSSVLSDKWKYPSFLRTTASNKDLIHLIILIIQHFNWNWVAFVSSGDENSQNGLQLFKSKLKDTKICLAYAKELNEMSDHYEILQQLEGLSIEVIIVFAGQSSAVALIKSAIKHNIHNKVWIAGDSWSLNKNLPRLSGIKAIGTIIGITETVMPLPGFKDFVYLSQTQRNNRPSTCEQTPSRQTCNQACDLCSDVSPEEIIGENPSYSFATYSAIYAMAHALHNLLLCDIKGCSDNVTVYPFMLLRELKRSNFTILNRHIEFDSNGDPTSTSYAIVFWNQSGQAEKVGSYETDPTLDVPFSINNTQIHWYADQVPVARCSPECSEGFAKKIDGLHQCCFQCNVCPGMTYVNYTDDPYSCIDCRKTEWSKPGSTFCTQRSVEYILFTDPIAITLMFSTGVLLALTLAIVILFALNYDKPVVKSAGGPMCFLLLGCLSVSSISVFFFFGKPTVTNCALRYFLFLLFYTVCLGCFAVRSFQIVCIFKMATKFPKIHSWWVKHNGQWWLIAIVFVLQLLLLTTVFTASPPTPVSDMTSYRDQIILKCAMTRTVIMFLLLTIVLASLCFIFSYMGKDLPKNYNESKAITLYLLFLILTWITFCTASILYHGKYLQLFNAMSVLSSSYSILFCYFLPKCYIIIFQPQKNTQQHFQGIIQRYTQNISSK